MSLLISLLGGLSAKAYDDLNDNSLLYKFKNNFIMEYLKGVHFVTFTTISINDPLFFIVSYIANVFNYLGNNDAYSEDYENSLLYSFLLLFVIIDYTKIESNSILDILLLVCMCIAMFIEPIIMRYFLQNCEFSYSKLIARTLLLIFSFICYYIGTSKTVKYLFSYCMGYFIMSMLVQYYSLIQSTKLQDEDIINQNITNESVTNESVTNESVTNESVTNQ